MVEPKLAGDILDERIADLNVRFRMGKIDLQPDGKQGRVTLEQHLLDYAGISRDVIAVGVGQYWRLMAPDQVPEKEEVSLFHSRAGTWCALPKSTIVRKRRVRLS